ncbi:MAG: alpha/beta hydrolase, partial [Gemmatimonadales bacterium]
CSANRMGEAATSSERKRRAGEDHRQGRLTARPGQGRSSARHTVPTGPRALGLGGERDGLLYVPAGYSPERPAPLALMLHGAGGSAGRGLHRLHALADESGIILLAPDSRGRTWDIIMGRYGPDVAFLDLALEQTLAQYNVDPGRVAAEGFSDGATYALSLGLTNGDLFTHLIAFSPGFVASGSAHGAPKLFVSHGTEDPILPIEQCSRRIVPGLRRAGYRVTYQEFDGSHEVPPGIARQAVEWLVSEA